MHVEGEVDPEAHLRHGTSILVPPALQAHFQSFLDIGEGPGRYSGRLEDLLEVLFAFVIMAFAKRSKLGSQLRPC